MTFLLFTIQTIEKLANEDTILGLSLAVFFTIIGVLYFFPSIIALIRGKQNTIAIMALNFFLGWSVVGWVVSLVWSLSSDNKPQRIIVNQNSSANAKNEDKFEQLDKLQKLLDNGTITQKEFNSQKKKLLRK